jgi:hypothetical protein
MARSGARFGVEIPLYGKASRLVDERYQGTHPMKLRKTLTIMAGICLVLCVLASVFLAVVWFWPDPRFHESIFRKRQDLFLFRLRYIFQHDSARDYRVAKMEESIGLDLTQQETDAFLKASGNQIAAQGVLFMLRGYSKYLAPLKSHEDDPLACYILSYGPSEPGQALHYAQRYAELDPGNAFAHLNLAAGYERNKDLPGQLREIREAAKCTRYENPMAEVIRAYVDHAECFDSLVNLKAMTCFYSSIFGSSMRHMKLNVAGSHKPVSADFCELAALQLKSLDQVLQSPLMSYCYDMGNHPEIIRMKCYQNARVMLGSDASILQFKPTMKFYELEQQNQAEERWREKLRKASPAEVDAIIRENLEALRRVVSQ